MKRQDLDKIKSGENKSRQLIQDIIDLKPVGKLNGQEYYRNKQGALLSRQSLGEVLGLLQIKLNED